MLLDTSRKHSIQFPIPREIVLPGETAGSYWIQLARTPEHLKFGTCLHLVDVFDRTARPRAPIEYRSVAGSGNEQPGPRAGNLLQLVTIYGYVSMPPVLVKTISERSGPDAFSHQHHGIWAELEPTPRALGFISRRQIRFIVTDWVEDLNGLGSAIVGVSFA
jgi:hypothetical protein